MGLLYLFLIIILDAECVEFHLRPSPYIFVVNLCYLCLSPSLSRMYIVATHSVMTNCEESDIKIAARNRYYKDLLLLLLLALQPTMYLAFSVIFFHSALSSHCFLHRLIPIIFKSFSMPTIHLFLGLPLVLVPIGFHCNILLGVLLSSIRIT